MNCITTLARPSSLRRSVRASVAFSTSSKAYVSARPLRFSIGVGYGGKDTPPIATVKEAEEVTKQGFQPGTRIGRWHREMLALGGGRTEMFDTKKESKENDWEKGNKGVLDRQRWGAGDDAFFVNQSGNFKTFVSVTDGVGGWSLHGVDPSLYPQALSYHTYHATVKNPSITAKSALEKGFQGVIEDPDIKLGSATMCVASLDSTSRQLEAVNLGDSGFSIIRDGRIFSSTAQTLYFNAPFQLSKYGDKKPSDESLLAEEPKHAESFKQDIAAGDMIILYTDGLSDNLWPDQLVALLKHVDTLLASPENSFLQPEERERERARVYADALIAYGRMIMTKEDVVTPFEAGAAAARQRMWGGKVDDITVVTVHVGEGS